MVILLGITNHHDPLVRPYQSLISWGKRGVGVNVGPLDSFVFCGNLETPDEQFLLVFPGGGVMGENSGPFFRFVFRKMICE